MLVYYFITAVVFSGLVFWLKSKLANNILMSLFLLFQVVLTVYAYFNQGEADSVYFSFDALGILLTGVLALLGIATFYHSTLYLKRNTPLASHQGIYCSALILLIMAMTGAYFAGNLALLWIFIETTTLCVSLLIFHSRTKIALEASWKYLFISSVGVAIAFMGILFHSVAAVDTNSNSLDILNLINNATRMNPTWLKISFILVLTGFSIKMNIFPLYAAAIDAKTIAPTPINALMSSALLSVGFVGIFRFYSIIVHTNAVEWAQKAWMLVGIVSIFLAAIQLFRIKRYSRMYAFSSMEHMGLVALAMYAGGVGYYAAILHIILHSLVKSGLFYQLGQSNYLFQSIWIKNSGGYYKINPLGGLAVLLGLVSITAIPPSGLFMSEFLIFKSLFLSKHYLISGVALLFIAVILYIMGRNVLHLLYAERPESYNANPLRPHRHETYSQFILFGLAIYLGYCPPQFFKNLINSAIALL